LINDRAARLKAIKKRDSPAKTSTKITPTQKRKKLKRTPAKDCAKESIASSASSSSSSKSSSSEDDDDEDEDNNTDKEPGNNTDDNDNDGNDNDDDNDDNSDNGNDNDNDNNKDIDNNSGFMNQDLYDPKDDPEDGLIVTV
jgi:hypothetical protein